MLTTFLTNCWHFQRPITAIYAWFWEEARLFSSINKTSLPKAAMMNDVSARYSRLQINCPVSCRLRHDTWFRFDKTSASSRSFANPDRKRRRHPLQNIQSHPEITDVTRFLKHIIGVWSAPAMGDNEDTASCYLRGRHSLLTLMKTNTASETLNSWFTSFVLAE